MGPPDKADAAGAPAGVCGILVIDKPVGITSMDAVAAVRRRASGARTGHAGTLDPLASGVLVLGLGAATRRLDRFMGAAKRYRTVVDLSAFTSTDDREGQRVEVDAEPPGMDRLRAAVAALTGPILQRPPAHSAVNVGGRRAYQRARRGETVELAARPVVVHAIEVVGYQWPEVELDITCGKGTYIRSLARDLGAALGTGGHCRSLRRTAVGPFDELEARTLESLPEHLTQADLLELDKALRRLEGALG